MATEIERSGMDIGGPHEPSYYEIALTNRQVVVAFIVLLVCLVAAFFSGVWIGRESSTRTLLQLARATPPASSAAVNPLSGANAEGTAGTPGNADRPDGQALQEFKFFNESRKKPGKGAEPAKPPAASLPSAAGTAAAPERLVMPPAAALPERTGARQKPSAPEPAGQRPANAREPAARQAAPAPMAPMTPKPAGAGAAPSSPPTEIEGEGEPLTAAAGSPVRAGKPSDAGNAGSPASSAETAGSPAAANPPATAAASSRPAPAPRAAAGAEGGTGVVIQVFSSADKAQAERIRERLVKAGQPAYLSPIDKAGQTMYRVRIGPFPSREKAEKVADQVRREQKLDTWITPK
jgi:cell division septation protein DedD